MKTLKTAVIGLGRIGWQFHIPEIRRHDGFRLAAVMDPLAERLAEAKNEFGAELRGYADIETLLDRESLDLIVIASPTGFHAAQTLAAFEHGVDVLCDKPMALNLAACDRMIAGKEQRGRKLMVYQPHRTRPEIVALRAILAEGKLGPLFMMKRACAGYSRRHDWQAWRKHGGGMLANYGAHYIDQMLYVAQSPARKTSCALRTVASLGDADDVVKAVMETESGIILDLDINMAVAQPLPAWMVFGKYGTAALDLAANAWNLRYVDPAQLPERNLQKGLAATDRQYCGEAEIPWQEETIALVDYDAVDFYAQAYAYYAEDAPPFIDVDETREVMRVINACRIDAEEA